MLRSTAVVVIAGLALITAGAPPAPAEPASPPRPARPAGAPTSALLVTGDRVTFDASGGTTGTIHRAAASGPGSVLVRLTLGTRSYAIPASAVPYFGRGLDPSLFELDALRRYGDRVPVRITHTGATPRLPGVTVTAATGGTADGYLTPASARSFGAALATQYRADRNRGRYGGQGLFAGVTGIALPGAPRQPARPRAALHTLTMTATDATGAPDQDDAVVVANVDDTSLFGDPFESVNWFADGAARFSVPAGNYTAIALFTELDATGEVTGVRVVPRTQFTVAGETTVDVSAAAASSTVTMVTPRPAEPQEGGFVYRRTPAVADGGWLYVDVLVGPGVPVRVAPNPTPVTVGGLQSYPWRRLTSPPATRGTPYEYTLQPVTNGSIPPQRYRIRPAELATIDARYYSDIPSTGERVRLGYYAFEVNDWVVRPAYPIALPRAQTEYLTGDPSITWLNETAKYLRADGLGLGGQYDTRRSYRPGARGTETWNAYPLHPSGQHSARPADFWPIFPPAIRQGDRFEFQMWPFGDNQPGHTSTGLYGEPQDGITGTYRLEQNGVPIAEGNAQDDPEFGVAYVAAGLDPAPATLRLRLDAHRGGPTYPLSTDSTTEWTWRSTHQDGVDSRPPLICGFDEIGWTYDCRIEPLLTTEYHVAGLRLDGSARPGAQLLNLIVGHQQGSAASAITGATVSYSVDDGTTWRRAATSGHSGRYRAGYVVPPGTRYVALRVDATDAAGGRITETIRRAYRVAG